MYSKRSTLVIGFHGCDAAVREELVTGKSSIKKSQNDYDWLGHGMYVWDNDPERALQFAQFKKEHPQKGKENIVHPCVVGVIINPGFCLDLMSTSSLALLKAGYEILVANIEKSGRELQKNKPLKGGEDLIFRYLDCAVIETLHAFRNENGLGPFDSVRGVFWEGKDLYENAGFKEKNHIQICIRNPNCIKGFFIPRETDEDFNMP